MITLKEARKAKGLTQEELAKMVGLKPTTIASYEQGARKPDVFKAGEIAKILEVSLDVLYFGK